MELSIKDYSTMQGISPQAVYQAIDKGRLKVIIKNGKKYVVTSAEDIKPVDKPSNKAIDKSLVKDLMKLLKRRDNEVKTLQKEIKRLTKKNESLFSSYLGQYQKALDHKPDNEDIIVKAKKSKKNKRKK